MITYFEHLNISDLYVADARKLLAEGDLYDVTKKLCGCYGAPHNGLGTSIHGGSEPLKGFLGEYLLRKGFWKS